MKIDPSNIKIFEGISGEEMDQIVKYAFIKSFEPGYVLFRENLIVGQIMYVILSGKVDLSKKNNEDEDVVFLTLGPGALLGEMSLFEQDKRSATATIREYSELLVMPKYNFDRMLQSRPNEAIKILLNFIKVLSQRLRETTNKMIRTQDDNKPETNGQQLAAPQPAHTTPAPEATQSAQAAFDAAQSPSEKLAIKIGQPTQISKIEMASDLKNNELYILTMEELQSENLVKIIEDKRRHGYTTDNATRVLMVRDILNYYLQLPMEELQLKVREMELRFRSRTK
ncbi:MAG: cyclic nucleotide-binding domain-containing protein [Rhizobacter sp.]|nr:cyclic nucleotide-binding domain-containing protein [Chlorobiales bacterium]